MSLRNRENILQRPDTGSPTCNWPLSWTICCSLKPHQTWSSLKGGCQEAILTEGKQGEKAEIWQITLDWTGLKISGNRGEKIPRAQTSTLFKQYGIIVTENGTKGSQHSRKRSEKSFKEPRDLFMKTTKRNFKEDCLRGFRLCWRIKVV